MEYTAEEKEWILKKAYELGFHYERSFHGCAQSVIGAIRELFDITDIIFKIGAGFSGGIGDEAIGTCGAFSGSIIVLGYFFGRDIEYITISGSKFKCRDLVRDLRRKYHNHYGGENCRDVQKTIFEGKCFNMGNKEEKLLFQAAGAHDDKCTGVVGNAAKWLAEILLDEGIAIRAGIQKT